MARAKRRRQPSRESSNDPPTADPKVGSISKIKKKEIKPKVEKIKKVKAAKKVKIVLPKDPKLRVPKKPENVLLVDSKKHLKDSTLRKIFKVLIATFYEFAAITKVNGMYYLRQSVTHGWLRLLWSCIMISLLSFAATLIYLLYRRYLDSPTRVTIDPPMSINSIPFPAVTICHPQNVMEYKSREFVKRV
jgi:Amiloride-sensitive sodium channel